MKESGIMKRVALALCCAAAISACASAAAQRPGVTIGELREAARSGWHQTYATARGETVAVDVEIDVPDVDAFPCYYARDMRPVDGVPDGKGDLAEMGEEGFVNEDGFFRYDWPNRSTQRAWRTAAQKSGAALDSFGEPRALILRYGQFDMDTAYSVNNPTTMAEASALMQACLATYFPSVRLTPRGIHAHVEPGRYKRNKDTGDYEMTEADPDFQGCFFGYFDQLIDGIPVLGRGYQGYAGYRGSSRKEEMLGDLGGICVTQGLRECGSDALYRSLQFRLIETTDQIAGDVPLCGLDAVLATAGRLIEAGQLRTVDSLRLGYVVWQDRAHTYRLMPTWVIEGELFENAGAGYRVPVTGLTDEPLEQASVYIDAQTGELIDPFSAGEGRAYDAPALIEWQISR